MFVYVNVFNMFLTLVPDTDTQTGTLFFCLFFSSPSPTLFSWIVYCVLLAETHSPPTKKQKKVCLDFPAILENILKPCMCAYLSVCFLQVDDLHRHKIDHITIPSSRGPEFGVLRRVDDVRF